MEFGESFLMSRENSFPWFKPIRPTGLVLPGQRIVAATARNGREALHARARSICAWKSAKSCVDKRAKYNAAD